MGSRGLGLKLLGGGFGLVALIRVWKLSCELKVNVDNVVRGVPGVGEVRKRSGKIGEFKKLGTRGDGDCLCLWAETPKFELGLGISGLRSEVSKSSLEELAKASIPLLALLASNLECT